MIVDEAHRSHYDNLDGFARHIRDALPDAVYIAFTGTPISFSDRNTQEVFGDYIDVYDLTRAVDDGATVPVYFEPRLIKVGFAKGSPKMTSTMPPTRPPSASTTSNAPGSSSLSPSSTPCTAHQNDWRLSCRHRRALGNPLDRDDKFIEFPGRPSSSARLARSAPISTTRSSRCGRTGTTTL